MDEFLEDLTSGELQARDRWQFELKSEFFPSSSERQSTYNQEFYFFIPNALQINQNTYSKEEFYQDLTNFIRYKTPEFGLKDILTKSTSPFNRLKMLNEQSAAEIELKLLGSVFRSSVRDRVHDILSYDDARRNQAIMDLCHDITAFRNALIPLKETLLQHFTSSHFQTTFKYVDEFLSNTLDYLLTGLLDELKKQQKPISLESEHLLCDLIIKEKQHRDEIYHMPETKGEQILYRSGLLKKFVMDALLLPTFRSSLQERYGHLIGGLSAGIAMLLYISLFAWFGQAFVITSLPFILLTVVTYILKDRLKEGMKALSYQKALKWFSDFSTEIRSPDEKKALGVLKESFTFIDEVEIPGDIRTIRSRDFHYVLETFKRPEQIIYYKRSVTMHPYMSSPHARFYALNIILRFNIQDFVEKASNPYHAYTTLNSETKTLLHMRLPKVYHLNIILKNTYVDQKNKQVIELKNYRLIIDKNGIKHIEHIQPKTISK